MEKSRALELIKQSLEVIPVLRKLRYDNQHFKLWLSKVETIVKEGLADDDYERLDSVQAKYFPDELEIDNLLFEVNYLPKLNDYEVALKSIILKYEMLRGEIMTNSATDMPVAFVAHGGESPALSKLKAFLVALGVKPLVVEDEPSEGRSVAANVDHYAKRAHYAVILATRGDIDSDTGGFIPRGNVLMEIGKLQEIFGNKIVYLLETGAQFPSNVREKVWTRFTPQSMDRAFTKVALEFRACGILKASIPTQ